jgi:hypothetical protein
LSKTPSPWYASPPLLFTRGCLGLTQKTVYGQDVVPGPALISRHQVERHPGAARHPVARRLGVACVGVPSSPCASWGQEGRHLAGKPDCGGAVPFHSIPWIHPHKQVFASFRQQKTRCLKPVCPRVQVHCMSACSPSLGLQKIFCPEPTPCVAPGKSAARAPQFLSVSSCHQGRSTHLFMASHADHRLLAQPLLFRSAKSSFWKSA